MRAPQWRAGTAVTVTPVALSSKEPGADALDRTPELDLPEAQARARGGSKSCTDSHQRSETMRLKPTPLTKSSTPFGTTAMGEAIRRLRMERHTARSEGRL